MEVIKEYFKNFNWNGPEALALFGIFVFGVMRKWILVSLVLFVFIIGANIEKYVFVYYQFNDVNVGASLIVYVVGGIVIVLAAFFSLFNK
jgi:hypothetical protein